MAERDYSGVSTTALKEFIESRVPEGREVWAESVGIEKRTLRRVFEEQYQWTGLAIADRAAHAFDLNVDDVFTVIPGNTNNAARKMARDELEVLAESWGLPDPTLEEIEQRAAELEALRSKVLGPPTAEQIARLTADNARTQERLARQRKEKREAADTKIFARAV